MLNHRRRERLAFAGLAALVLAAVFTPMGYSLYQGQQTHDALCRMAETVGSEPYAIQRKGDTSKSNPGRFYDQQLETEFERVKGELRC